MVAGNNGADFVAGGLGAGCVFDAASRRDDELVCRQHKFTGWPCADRGVGDGQIDYLFADEAEHEGGAQAIADEAAAGAYDMVVLSHGYFDDDVIEEESTPQEVAAAVQEIGDVSLVVC